MFWWILKQVWAFKDFCISKCVWSLNHNTPILENQNTSYLWLETVKKSRKIDNVLSPNLDTTDTTWIICGYHTDMTDIAQIPCRYHKISLESHVTFCFNQSECWKLHIWYISWNFMKLHPKNISFKEQSTAKN